MINHLSSKALFRSIQICVIALLLSLAAAAQDKDTCAGTGWEPMFINDVSILGSWTTTQNRDCRESARWQFSVSLKITQDQNGNYLGQLGGEEPTQVRVSGSQFRWTRDLRKGAGPDKNQSFNQTWTGMIQRNRKTGAIRIYGTWSGAYAFLLDNTELNHDFMIVIK